MRGHRRFAAIAALIAACLSVPATAAALPGDFASLRRQDTLLQRVGHRLATGNAALCPQTQPATGLLLHDLATYDSGMAQELRTALGLTGPVGVEAVAPGSPADRAGIAVDDTLIAVGSRPVANFALDEGRSWRRVGQIEQAIAALLANGGTARLTLARGGRTRTVELGAAPACATRFEVVAMGGKAAAEGSRVVIGQGFAGFGYPEDEFAAALAHELAHNILRHRAVLDARGRGAGNTRETEREADRMMPWLLANAGYDPAAAIRFMQRFGPGHDWGILREPTHDGWADRAQRIALETQLVALTRQVTGAADWRPRFAAELARSAALAAPDAATGG